MRDLNVSRKIRDITYITSQGDKENAALIKVALPAELITADKKFLLVLEKLSKAVNLFNSIIAQQRDHDVTQVYKAIEEYSQSLPIGSPDRKSVDDYLDLLSASNSLFDHDGLAIVFPITPDKIEEKFMLVKNFSQEFSSLHNIPKKHLPSRGLYPKDITHEELSKLSLSDQELINSSVVRDESGGLVVVNNEKKFLLVISKVIKELEEVLPLVDGKLLVYLKAVIDELRSGSKVHRFASDIAWLKNDHEIDFKFRTAEETYIDEFKGVRGGAASSLMLVDKKYMGLCKKISSLLPEIESTAPWKNKKVIVDSAIPDLRVVNVISWSGDYDDLPFNTMAQALPNEKEVIDKHGSRLMIYGNIQEAIRKSGIYDIVAKEMMTKSELQKYSSRMNYDLTMKMTIAHEQGHTTGGVVISKDPRIVFGKDYSVMEEARAELISMFALPIMAKHGIIDNEDVVAGYYSMLQAIGVNLRVNPLHHAGSRKMMFNFFVEHGGLLSVNEDGRERFVVDPVKMPLVVSKMLALIGNFKAEGKIDDFVKFKDHYFTSDPKGQEEYFKKKITGLPRGRLLIFPELNDGAWSFSDNYRDQKKTLKHQI
ncbi:MAG: hypothetical protein AABW73_01545 [Nanoarchaeota archaeon]